jgi:dTDP-4-dehydrorhamnose reductase
MNSRFLNKLEKLKLNKKMERVLLIGGNGQIGEGLLEPLNYIYGEKNVLVTDQSSTSLASNYIQLDAMDNKSMTQIFDDFKPNLVFHLVALLSGNFPT